MACRGSCSTGKSSGSPWPRAWRPQTRTEPSTAHRPHQPVSCDVATCLTPRKGCQGPPPREELLQARKRQAASVPTDFPYIRVAFAGRSTSTSMILRAGAAPARLFINARPRRDRRRRRNCVPKSAGLGIARPYTHVPLAQHSPTKSAEIPPGRSINRPQTRTSTATAPPPHTRTAGPAGPLPCGGGGGATFPFPLPDISRTRQRPRPAVRGVPGL